MAKVRAERQENLLAVSLGEAALEIAREHLPEHVAEILANLAEAYADLQHAAPGQRVPRRGRRVARTGSRHSSPERHPQRSGRRADRPWPGAASPTATLLVRSRRSRGPSAVAQQNEFSDMELVAHGLLAEVFKSLGRFEERIAASRGVHAHPRTDLQPRHRSAHQDAADLARHPCCSRSGGAAAGAYHRARRVGHGAHAGSRGAALRGVRAAGGDRRVPRPGLRRALDRGSASWRPSSRCELGEDRGWAEELRLGRATARRRQGRCARLHPAEAGLADGRTSSRS